MISIIAVFLLSLILMIHTGYWVYYEIFQKNDILAIKELIWVAVSSIILILITR